MFLLKVPKKVHNRVPKKSAPKIVHKKVHKIVPKKVQRLLKVPKKVPKIVIFLKIVPKIALLRALFGDQTLYAIFSLLVLFYLLYPFVLLQKRLKLELLEENDAHEEEPKDAIAKVAEHMVEVTDEAQRFPGQKKC